MTRQSHAFLCVGLLMINSLAFASDAIDLAGSWRFALDREDQGLDQGLDQGWFQADLPGAAVIDLPGSLQERGYGDPPGPDTPWVGTIRYDEWDKPQ